MCKKTPKNKHTHTKTLTFKDGVTVMLHLRSTNNHIKWLLLVSP